MKFARNATIVMIDIDETEFKEFVDLSCCWTEAIVSQSDEVSSGGTNRADGAGQRAHRDPDGAFNAFFFFASAKVLLENGHWDKYELSKVTMNELKPRIKVSLAASLRGICALRAGGASSLLSRCAAAHRRLELTGRRTRI